MRDLENDEEFPPATDEEQRQVWSDMALQNELFRLARNVSILQTTTRCALAYALALYVSFVGQTDKPPPPVSLTYEGALRVAMFEAFEAHAFDPVSVSDIRPGRKPRKRKRAHAPTMRRPGRRRQGGRKTTPKTSSRF